STTVNSVTVDAQGDVVMASTTPSPNSTVLVKFTTIGDLVWASEWISPNGIAAVATDPQRNIYVAGPDLLKVDPAGGLLWAKRDLTNRAQSLAWAPNGQLLVAGELPVGSLIPGYFVSRYDASGLLLGSRAIRGAGGGDPPGLTAGLGGEAIVVGIG